MNYSVAATLELKVIAELVSRKLERSHAFTARVKDHQQYIKSSADNLSKATGNGIKVGACREFEPFDAPNFQTPFNTLATKPGEPGAPEDRNWDHVGAWPQAFVRFWLQRPDPFSPSGIHFLENEVKHHWACQHGDPKCPPFPPLGNPKGRLQSKYLVILLFSELKKRNSLHKCYLHWKVLRLNLLKNLLLSGQNSLKLESGSNSGRVGYSDTTGAYCTNLPFMQH